MRGVMCVVRDVHMNRGSKPRSLAEMSITCGSPSWTTRCGCVPGSDIARDMLNVDVRVRRGNRLRCYAVMYDVYEEY